MTLHRKANVLRSQWYKPTKADLTTSGCQPSRGWNNVKAFLAPMVLAVIDGMISPLHLFL